MKYLTLLFLVFSISTEAKNFELTGGFGSNSITRSPVQFSMKWSETEGIARGSYRDDVHGTSELLKGITSEHGKIFLVTFNKPKTGVRSLLIVAPEEKELEKSKTIPVSVVTRDSEGTPILTVSTEAKLTQISPEIAQAQEVDPCQEGFGALAGVCGIYAGTISEESDSRKLCSLNTEKNLRLGITENASVVLLLGPESEIVEVPAHNLGRLPAESASNRVSVLNRQCRPLVGTKFSNDSCKILDLSGEFTNRAGTMHFMGSYTIIDEKNKNLCRYRLSFDQSKP